MKKSLTLLILIALVFIQCKEDIPANPGDIDGDKTESNIEQFGEANNALAFDLFQKVLEEDDEEGQNVVVSPLSVHGALLMTLNGADRETHEAIAKTLHSDTYSESSLNKAFEEYGDYLRGIPNTVLDISNSVFWDRNRMEIDAGFGERMVDHYDAELSGLELQDQSALLAINGWVDEATNGRISKILDKINPEEVMFLLNALYFTGDWANTFDDDWTFDRVFRNDRDLVTEVPTMSMDAYLPFFLGPNVQAVDLMFADSAFSMTFIQPSDPDITIRDFAASFGPSDLDDLYESKTFSTDRVLLYLPKFETGYKVNMNSTLKSLGMEIAFNPQLADLTRLGNAPEGNLYVSRVEHKTYLKIDEKGAEGAAVTSVGVGVTSVPPTLAFDRPFMFVLRDLRFNTIVFIGTIEDPLAN